MTSEIQTKTGTATGVAMRYAEWNASAQPTLLLLHPWPERICAWEDKAAYGDAAAEWVEGGFARVGGEV